MADIYQVLFSTFSSVVDDTLEDLAWGKYEQAEIRLRTIQKMIEEISDSWNGDAESNGCG